MVHIKSGNVFDEMDSENVFTIVTTNGTVKKDGALVMGAGAAKELCGRFHGFDRFAGATITDCYNKEIIRKYRGEFEYFFLMITRNVGIYQVKYGFREKASLFLVNRSTEQLKNVALSFPNVTFNVNFPAIGNGGLKESRILEYIHYIELPNNINFWKLK